MAVARTCAVVSCCRLRASGHLGLCGPHYMRRRRHGDEADMEAPIRARRAMSYPCSVDGCGRNRRSGGLCPRHYQLRRKYGRTHNVVRRKGAGSFNSYGYHTVMQAGRRRLWHRVVMEQMLGRPIRDDEVVHHINGIRADNRPENLELWSVMQPPGQRVQDKLSWAYELIARYEPEWVGGGC